MGSSRKMLERKGLFIVLALLCSMAKAGCPFSSSEDHPTIADPDTTTPNGCKCTSLCGATIEDGFTADWCYTEGCGEYSVVWGYWDYCQYLASSKPDWLALDWKVKQDLIWAEVQADPTSGEYHTEQMLTEGIMTTFENQ